MMSEAQEHDDSPVVLGYAMPTTVVRRGDRLSILSLILVIGTWVIIVAVLVGDWPSWAGALLFPFWLGLSVAALVIGKIAERRHVGPRESRPMIAGVAVFAAMANIAIVATGLFLLGWLLLCSMFFM